MKAADLKPSWGLVKLWISFGSCCTQSDVTKKKKTENDGGTLTNGFWLRQSILSVLMVVKPHREYDSCRASIVTAEYCLSPALKYHGLDQTPMAIIRYCGSEPKVNQCLNISFSCWIAKDSFSPLLFTLFGLNKNKINKNKQPTI